MVLMYWWVGGIWIVALAVLVVLHRKGVLKYWQPKHTVTKVAHGERVTRLPEYIARKSIPPSSLPLVTASLSLFFSHIVLSGLPGHASIVTPAQVNRDIVLGFDVSGSMKNVDVKLVETFQQLVRDFRGQRIGLDMFNYNNSQVFPLTDDYDLVNEQLAYVKKMLAIDPMNASSDAATEYYNFVAGTSSTGISGGGRLCPELKCGHWTRWLCSTSWRKPCQSVNSLSSWHLTMSWAASRRMPL